MKTAFNTASFAFRQVDYHATGDWGQACRTSREYFSPIETLAGRFDAMLAEIDDLGYKQLELWHFHLHQKWWTPEHVRIVLGLLAQRQMTLVGYCGGFGNDLPEVEQTLNLVNALGISLLAGATSVFSTQRAELVARLKVHGVRLARENHPEKTPQEILDLTGPDEGGLVGITVDTGWLGTQGYPADQALRELGERVYHVHLKDVFHVGTPHETCGFGKGVVPLEGCVQTLKAMNYDGFISVEHEPEQFDPRPDLKDARAKLESWLGGAGMTTSPVRLAIIGCGVIATPYAKDIEGFDSLKLHGCFDVDLDKARQYAEAHGCRAYASLEDALDDPEVDVVVNLTVLPAHYSVNKQALAAGKHVYSEKPLAATAEQAQELVSLARERGVRLSGAPATWLGHAQQRALQELQAGSIGPVRVIYAEANHGRIERWHPVPHSFYQVGPLRDVGVYPLGVITSIFGPARRVWAYATILKPQRQTKRGQPFEVSAPDWYAVMIELESGPLVRLTASFYVSDKGAQPEGIEFHGDDGQLFLGDWFQPGAFLRRADFGESYRDLPDFTPSPTGFSWAAGLDDLARAIREDRPHRLSGEQAAHIVEILEAAHQSIASGQPVEVHSRFVPAAPVS